MNIYLETLGCSKNTVDSEIMLSSLVKNAFLPVEDPEKAKIIIVNTCAFLTSAVEESIRRILNLSEMKQQGECERLIVAGCMVQRYREKLFEEIPEIDGMIGTGDYTRILDCVRQSLEDAEHKAYFVEKRPVYSLANSESPRTLTTPQHFAYLKISEGCSNMCSFCNIPKLRGRFTGIPLPHVTKNFLDLLALNIKEINIISQDSSSYGADFPEEKNLHDLLEHLLKKAPDSSYWLRVFYSYPNRYPTEIFDLMNRYEQMIPYVDMPFQHINDKVLKNMNRRITRERIESILELAYKKVPSVSFRTTFITGFPTETESDFEELLAFIQEGHFRHVGVFCYSYEDNIASARYEDPLPQKEKEMRRKLLMEAQQEISLKKNRELVGQKMKVLIEGVSEETDLLLQGRSFMQAHEVDGLIYINEGTAVQGDFCEVEITEAHPYDLVGKIIS